MIANSWVQDVCLIIAALGSAAAVVIGAVNHRIVTASKEETLNLKVAVDGRLSQLLEQTSKASKAEGVAEGRAANGGGTTV